MQELTNESLDRALGASYRLVDVVGQGATGQVWRAVDRRTDETVAAKVLRTEHVSDRDLVTRFVQERSVLTGLRHPNLVAVRDLVVEGDRLAIVMDYLEGGSLREVIREHGPLEPAVAVAVCAEVLEGLAAAHAKRLVHRDIKPDNVLLTESWVSLGPGAVRLTDFGIARIVGEGEKTTTGLLGTPEYMSPELLTTGGADLPSDVYGIGILLYELLAARTPFAGPGTDYTVAHRHVSSQAPRLPVPDTLWHAMEKLLDKDPRQRPPARQAADLLRRLLPDLAGVPPLVEQRAPEEFESARGPATAVRGLSPEAPPAEPDESDEERLSLEDLDLGAPASATIVRAMPRPRTTARPQVVAEPEEPATPWWQDRRVLAGVAGTLVLIVGVAFIVLHGRAGAASSPGGGSDGFSVALPDAQPAPSGLTVSRSADYDPDNQLVDLDITFTSQTSALKGPFLVVIPGLTRHSDCPRLNWKNGPQSMNLPTTTGIDTLCSWSVDVGRIDAQSSATVTAEVSLPFASKDKLQAWVQAGSEATDAAIAQKVVSKSYVAQRLQDIQVTVPSSTVSGKSLPVFLYPVFPKGVDKEDPLYTSTSTGPASSLLEQIAGPDDGIRFIDDCSGGITVTGLDVTTVHPAQECAVGAQVGNFPKLESNGFTIVARAG